MASEIEAMNSNGEIRRQPAATASHVGESEIAALTAELKLLVEQLDSNWTGGTAVTPETAARIHALRERAQRLFGNAD